MITKDQYKEVTGVYPYDGFYLPKFTLEEIQIYLDNLGYNIIIHKAPWIKTMYHQVDQEMENIGDKEFYDPRVIALKANETPPERNDSEDAKSKDLISVFYKEIKKKLLSI